LISRSTARLREVLPDLAKRCGAPGADGFRDGLDRKGGHEFVKRGKSPAQASE
jgi:hypothetical protein